MTSPMNPYSPPLAQQAYVPMPSYEPQNAMALGEGTITLLRQTRPWVIVMSIFCFLGSALSLLGAVAVFALGAISPDKSIPAALGLVYLPFALLYVYPGIKLWSYGSAISRVAATRTVRDLDHALAQQKSFWKYVGIMMLSLIALY